MEVRIQKYLSDIGAMSRRMAEKEIAGGRITVNGIKATLGDKIDPEKDELLYKGKRIEKCNKKYYILLNKPSGYITSLSDERDRPTVKDLLEDLPDRVYPAGRLDFFSEGALICTNDGEFANRVTHPSYPCKKVYHVTVAGALADGVIPTLRRMRELDGEKIAPVQVSVLREENAYTVLEFVLKEGKNRQIRRMCEKCSLKVKQLKRISVGEVRLGNLPLGRWRRLTETEIASFAVKKD